MNLKISVLIFLLSFSVFSQKNLVNIDSLIKSDNYFVLKDIKYGSFDRNILDLWISNKENKSPLMIYIHGGGFGSGSKVVAAAQHAVPAGWRAFRGHGFQIYPDHKVTSRHQALHQR